jgi:PAT family beta-lactamase induction signal transducer AmpG
MLCLGFSSGPPFLLVGNTLGFWMREEGIALTAIGFLSWVGLTYSLKFLWAPLIDKVDVPVIGRILGHRRGWMVLAQLGVIASLTAMALTGPGGGLTLFGAFALGVAFASATQDIVVDAWRIEAASDSDELGLLSAAYQFGYRIAILVSEAAILLIANHFGWRLSYTVMAVLMAIGVSASLIAAEPLRAQKAFESKAETPLWTARGFYDAVIGPFREFFRVYGWLALLMLAMISFYQLPEYMTGPMYNPLYHDLGLSKDVVGSVRASIGLVATLVGITAGGFSALRFGYMPTLIAGIVLKMLVIANFATLAHAGPSVPVFGAVIAVDNFGIGFAGVALVTYMSSLTSLGYTATQYALLSSAYTYVGKFAKGFSGVIVERLAVGRPLLDAYALFFIGAGLLGLPALVLCIVLARATRDSPNNRRANR